MQRCSEHALGLAVSGGYCPERFSTLSFRVTSQRRAPVLSVFTGADTEVIDATVDGKRAFRESHDPSRPSPPMRNWGLQFYALPVEGVEVVLKTHALVAKSLMF